MKILFDQNVPRPLIRFLSNHKVVTSVAMGWAELKNGDLLRLAEANGFDLMVTADRNLSFQQNLTDRKLALLVLPSGQWPKLRPHTEQIAVAIDEATAGSLRVFPKSR